MISLIDVEDGAAHRAIGAEDAELRGGIGREAPVRRVMQRHERGAAHRTEQLRRPQAQQLRVVAAGDRRGQRDGGIKMRAGTAEGLRHQDAAEHSQSPSGCYHHPSGVSGIGLAKRNGGVHAIAQQDQYQRSHKLAKPHRMHQGCFRAEILESTRMVECRTQAKNRFSEPKHSALPAMLSPSGPSGAGLKTLPKLVPTRQEPPVFHGPGTQSEPPVSNLEVCCGSRLPCQCAASARVQHLQGPWRRPMRDR